MSIFNDLLFEITRKEVFAKTINIVIELGTVLCFTYVFLEQRTVPCSIIQSIYNKLQDT